MRLRRSVSALASACFVATSLFAGCGGSSTTAPGDGGGAQPFPDGSATGDASTNAPPSPEATCAAYVRCVSKTNPSGLGVILDTYGERGSCWEAGDPSLCAQACLAGLRSGRAVHPNEKACPTCFADAQCESRDKPGCHTGTGLCVECTTDAHCPGRACDTATNRCVPCTSDAQCSGATPACDTAKHVCVACNTDAQCPAGTPACNPSTHQCMQCRDGSQCAPNTPVCHARDNTCCASKSCEYYRALTQPKREVCGTINDSCAPIECGSCSSGLCIQQRCSNAGQHCTPPGRSTCAPGEICAWGEFQAAYVCTYDYTGAACKSPDYNGDQCANPTLNGRVQRFGFVCSGSTCIQTCKQSNECQNGGTCKLYDGRDFGSCQ